jgi:hypothetical protein
VNSHPHVQDRKVSRGLVTSSSGINGYIRYSAAELAATDAALAPRRIRPQSLLQAQSAHPAAACACSASGLTHRNGPLALGGQGKNWERRARTRARRLTRWRSRLTVRGQTAAVREEPLHPIPGGAGHHCVRSPRDRPAPTRRSPQAAGKRPGPSRNQRCRRAFRVASPGFDNGRAGCSLTNCAQPITRCAMAADNEIGAATWVPPSPRRRAAETPGTYEAAPAVHHRAGDR